MAWRPFLTITNWGPVHAPETEKDHQCRQHPGRQKSLTPNPRQPTVVGVLCTSLYGIPEMNWLIGEIRLTFLSWVVSVCPWRVCTDFRHTQWCSVSVRRRVKIRATAPICGAGRGRPKFVEIPRVPAVIGFVQESPTSPSFLADKKDSGIGWRWLGGCTTAGEAKGAFGREPDGRRGRLTCRVRSSLLLVDREWTALLKVRSNRETRWISWHHRSGIKAPRGREISRTGSASSLSN